MLERLRNHRRLPLWVLLGFGWALAVAMLSGAQTRQTLQYTDLCSTAHGPGAVPVQAVETVLGETTANAHQGHGSDPACVLCLALSTAPAVAQWPYRPPSAHATLLWLASDLPRAAKASAAPPPLRGPPRPMALA